MTKNRTIQIYRGTTAQNDAYTGSAGELTMDTTLNEIRIHDGSTEGGHKIGGGYHPELFAWQWADHEIDDTQWLNADTFSWQPGSTYSEAYAHLVADIDGKSLQTETVSGTTISFYLADDGHKICPAAQESNVSAIYTATGVAWYYIIDTTNTRFKLPRISRAEEEIKHIATSAIVEKTSSTNAVIVKIASSGSNVSNAQDLSVRGSSQMYVNSSNVPVNIDPNGTLRANLSNINTSYYSGKQHLYFYVGNFTQTALENTAGLNASLFNNKADIDLGNLNTAGKKVVAHLSMPSTRYDNLTLGVSRATYTAPADGWVFLSKTATASAQYVRITTPNGLQSENIAYASSNWCRAMLPVSKGTIFTVYYNADGTTNSFEFIYANGAQ